MKIRNILYKNGEIVIIRRKRQVLLLRWSLGKKKDEAKLEKAKKKENKKEEKEAEPKKGKTDREKVRAAKYKRIKKLRGKPNFDDLEKDLEFIDGQNIDVNYIKLLF